MSELATLLYWVQEREAIRVRKEGSQGILSSDGPWTADPILATYRFCNVRRKDDRVSRWLIKNVLNVFVDFQFVDMTPYLTFTALARWINWPPTIKAVMDAGLWPSLDPDWKAVVKVVEGTVGKVWTGAYLIPAPHAGDHFKSKIDYVVNGMVVPAIEPIALGLLAACAGGSREGVWQLLSSRHGWGSFLSGQVVADWGYTPLLADAGDTDDWAPMGPGSARGYNRVFGRPLNAAIDEDDWRLAIPKLREEIIGVLGSEYDNLTGHDCQNVLCEVDKFIRVRNGEGKPRARYHPETAY